MGGESELVTNTDGSLLRPDDHRREEKASLSSDQTDIRGFI